MKKYIALFALLVIGMTASAQEFTVDGILYTVISADEKTVETGGYAYNNAALVEINVPETVEYDGTVYTVTGIGRWFTTDYTQIVHIPKTVTYIMERAFHHRNALKEIHITDIGAWANINFIGEFAYCQPLGFWNMGYHTRLYLNGELLDAIELPEGTTQIKTAAFWGCIWAKHITLPKSLVTIGDRCFYGCYGFKTLVIPENVTSIQDYAFYECNALDSIVVKSASPATVSGKPFDDATLERATLYVPDGAIIAYATNEYWTKFKHIEVLKDETAIRDIRTNTTANAKAYNLGGVELPTPDAAKGIVIQGGKKTVRR